MRAGTAAAALGRVGTATLPAPSGLGGAPWDHSPLSHPITKTPLGSTSSLAYKTSTPLRNAAPRTSRHWFSAVTPARPICGSGCSPAPPPQRAHIPKDGVITETKEGGQINYHLLSVYYTPDTLLGILISSHRILRKYCWAHSIDLKTGFQESLVSHKSLTQEEMQPVFDPVFFPQTSHFPNSMADTQHFL